MSDSAQLLSMGFSEAKVKKALKSTKNSGLQPALDWLIAHVDDPEPVEGEEDTTMDEAGETEDNKIKRLEGEGTMKSLVCSDCGKRFKSTAVAEYHATKSGHENFEESTEEIKPLTEEEKKQKLEELRAAMQIKRAAKAQQDAEDAKQNEAIRRKAGKDQGQIKEDLKLKEAEKEALQRKKDKQLELEAKNRVKLQIEADKKARADKAAREKALREGKAPPSTDAGASGPSTVAAPTKSNASQARLQIRLPDGPPLVTTLPATNTLQTVADYVSAQKPELASPKFSMTFPRKVFSAADMQKTLGDLGLTPSAVLVVTA